MRILMWHVDYFKATLTQRGRSPLVEENNPSTIEANEAIVVFTSVEKIDESKPELIVQKTVDEIQKICLQLKVNIIVIHSFAHLFSDHLADPPIALDVMKKIVVKLNELSFTTYRTPFGWFNALEIKAKGHPLSRIGRKIQIDSSATE